MTAEDFKKEMLEYSSESDAIFLQRFFKTGKGEYGEGDIFLGARVPDTRVVCRLFKDLPLSEVQKLLNSAVHEHRLGAVIILVERFAKADKTEKRRIYDMYLKNVSKNNINNWDIVDVSAPKIVGKYLLDKDRSTLYRLAQSENIWERRVAMISTHTFIREGEFEDTLSLADALLGDKHDLIHKVAGWMLREAGKKDEDLLISYLEKNAHIMPRTMLRYSIEKLPQTKRRFYLNKRAA